MAEAREIQPETLEMFNLIHPYEVDQSFSKDDYLFIAPIGGASSQSLVYQITREADRMVDLSNTFIRAGLTLNCTTALTPNVMISLANNAIMHLFSNIILKINGEVVEQLSQAPGVFNTMTNLLYYPEENVLGMTLNCIHIVFLSLIARLC